jgi:TPR repeat protein
VFEANKRIQLALLCGVLSAFALATAWSQAYIHFPGAPQDRRTLHAKERVEELYEGGEYARALLIYEKELAPIGDKFAQYMVGYMNFAGQSIPPSSTTALAWYRLAAERDDAAIVQARDELLAAMTDSEIELSNEVFAEIWQELGDTRLLLDLIDADMKTLSERTGTRVPGGNNQALTVINVRSANSGVDHFYQQVSERVQLRLNYLDTEVEISDIAMESDLDDMRELEEDIRKKYSALRSP